MNPVLLSIISVLIGSGTTVALINTWGKVKLKRLDIASQEREQFVTEVNQLRAQMTELYKEYLDLMRNNAELKIQLEELRKKING
jgi:peptidoglycan hydrolase CwlO-like protein